MLSYRHAFHAGNHADVFKHGVLAVLVDYLKRKDKPFTYLDTHAGSGLYDLQSDHAQKNREFREGILRLWGEQHRFPELRPYFDCIRAANPAGQLNRYPGSAAIVQSLARNQDRLHLMELHNVEIDHLRQAMRRDHRVSVHHRDGFEGLRALTPPTPRRGLALIDPPYEDKKDYDAAVQTLKNVHKRWGVGTLLLWYPILAAKQDRSSRMLYTLSRAGFPGLLVTELSVRPDDAVRGMRGSGLAIVNPPWQLDQQIQAVLPRLAELLAENADAEYRCDWLTPPRG